MAKDIREMLTHEDAYGVGDQTLDLRYGGNYGYSPRVDEWLNNKALVRRDLVPILLTAPRMFSLFGSSQQSALVDTLKAFIELHCKTITGYDATLTVNTADQQVREEVQQEPVRVVRARSNPVMGAIEKDGGPMQRFIEWWIIHGILDPETNRVLAAGLSGAPSDWLADWYSMTLLVFEPDTMFRNVRRAWVSVNMYPLSTGDIIGLKDPDSDKTLLELSIPFSALSVCNEGTRIFAQKILREINITGAIPSNEKFFRDGIDAIVSGGTRGYIPGINTVQKNQIGGETGGTTNGTRNIT